MLFFWLLFLKALFISFLIIFTPFVTCPDLLSVLTPSTKCLLPGRSVYHWRRRRNNHRLVVSFSPHLPSLPLTSASNSGHVCFPAPNFPLIHFTSPPSFFPKCPLIQFVALLSTRLLKATFSEGLWLPPLLGLTSLFTTCYTTVDQHCPSICPLCTSSVFEHRVRLISLVLLFFFSS